MSRVTQLEGISESGRYADGSLAAGGVPNAGQVLSEVRDREIPQIGSWTWGRHSHFVKPQLSRNPDGEEAMAAIRVSEPYKKNRKVRRQISMLYALLLLLIFCPFGVMKGPRFESG